MAYNGLQRCLVALSLLLCSTMMKCDNLHVNLVTINSTTGDECPAADVLTNARQQLHESVNGLLTTLSVTTTTNAPTTATTAMDAPTTAMPGLTQSELFGGTGGAEFNDYNEDIAGINGMIIYVSGHPFIQHVAIESIQVIYRLKNGNTYTAPVHGATTGTRHSFTLAEGERLTRMEGSPTDNNYVIEQLTFYSNLNNMYGPYGYARPSTFFVEGREIVALFGRAGSLLDAIGAYHTN